MPLNSVVCIATGSKESKISLEFVSSLILHLLVDSYIDGHHANDPALQYPVLHPPFVRHALHSRARELDFGYLISLLKILLRISHTTYVQCLAAV